ncbi:MAG: DNA polymerase III subunit delta [Deltaproteobacteria bacterium]|jgi:DNA polymerase-3 subunit delta|nr:DNA polymerase III subunit delta [Deltaproteobacteria bacterium]MCL5879896.1 DNA polymerase III subunit delta [Deltaproteobacteria bacterium]MDA8303828.1 DNA polymerase III subunit delta [Deltaproteobacteria bacterium]
MEKDILVYFFYGEDGFRITKEIEKIKSGILKKDQMDFNFDRLISPSPLDFLTIADSYPVLSEKRVIQVEDFEDSFLNDTGLLDYLNSPSPATVIIFYDKSAKINENIKFFKELKAKNYFKLHKIRLLYENELLPYIKNLSKEKGIKISDEAIYYLIRYTGNNTLNIDNELNKIASGIKTENESKELSVDELKKVLAFSKTFNIFDFIDKIFDKDTRGAFGVFGVIYNNGEEPVKITSVLYNEVRKLHKAKVQESSGMDFETILRINSVLPFLKKKFLKNLSLFSVYELKRIMELLEETDFRLKTTSFPQNLIFEEFIFKLNFLNNPKNRHI